MAENQRAARRIDTAVQTIYNNKWRYPPAPMNATYSFNGVFPSAKWMVFLHVILFHRARHRAALFTTNFLHVPFSFDVRLPLPFFFDHARIFTLSPVYHG